MFQFPGFPPHALCIYASVTSLQLAGFPHSDIKGSMPACGSPLLFAACHVLLRRACLRLPLAFRSLPRPSSALGALASTLCSSSLDYVDPETRYIYFRLLSNLPNCNWSFKTFSRLSSLCSCQGAWVISHPIFPFPFVPVQMSVSLSES